MNPRQIISVLAFVLISAVGFAFADTLGPAAAPQATVIQRTSVLVLPFQMYGSTTDNAWIGPALQQNLTADIAHNPALQIVTASNVPATSDTNAVAQAARDAGASIALYGDYQISQGNVRVLGYLMDVSGNRVFSSIVSTGPITNLFAVEDQLNGQFDQAIAQQIPAAAMATNAPPTAQPQQVYTSVPYNSAAENTPAYQEYPVSSPYASPVYSPNYCPPTYCPNGYAGNYGAYPQFGSNLIFVPSGGFQRSGRDFDHRHFGNTGMGGVPSGQHFSGGSHENAGAAASRSTPRAAPQVSHSASPARASSGGGSGHRR